MTRHHPRCDHVDASLIDVWRVECGGSSFITTEEAAARAEADACEEGEAVTVTAEKMHREVLDALPEFDGF